MKFSLPTSYEYILNQNTKAMHNNRDLMLTPFSVSGKFPSTLHTMFYSPSLNDADRTVSQEQSIHSHDIPKANTQPLFRLHSSPIKPIYIRHLLTFPLPLYLHYYIHINSQKSPGATVKDAPPLRNPWA